MFGEGDAVQVPARLRNKSIVCSYQRRILEEGRKAHSSTALPGSVRCKLDFLL